MADGKKRAFPGAPRIPGGKRKPAPKPKPISFESVTDPSQYLKPAPVPKTTGAERRAIRQAGADSKLIRKSSKLTSKTLRDPKTVKGIQGELAAQGYPIDIDGVWGPQTQGAWEDWARRANKTAKLARSGAEKDAERLSREFQKDMVSLDPLQIQKKWGFQIAEEKRTFDAAQARIAKGLHPDPKIQEKIRQNQIAQTLGGEATPNTIGKSGLGMALGPEISRFVGLDALERWQRKKGLTTEQIMADTMAEWTDPAGSLTTFISDMADRYLTSGTSKYWTDISKGLGSVAQSGNGTLASGLASVPGMKTLEKFNRNFVRDVAEMGIGLPMFPLAIAFGDLKQLWRGLKEDYKDRYGHFSFAKFMEHPGYYLADAAAVAGGVAKAGEIAGIAARAATLGETGAAARVGRVIPSAAEKLAPEYIDVPGAGRVPVVTIRTAEGASVKIHAGRSAAMRLFQKAYTRLGENRALRLAEIRRIEAEGRKLTWKQRLDQRIGAGDTGRRYAKELKARSEVAADVRLTRVSRAATLSRKWLNSARIRRMSPNSLAAGEALRLVANYGFTDDAVKLIDERLAAMEKYDAPKENVERVRQARAIVVHELRQKKAGAGKGEWGKRKPTKFEAVVDEYRKLANDVQDELIKIGVLSPESAQLQLESPMAMFLDDWDRPSSEARDTLLEMLRTHPSNQIMLPDGSMAPNLVVLDAYTDILDWAAITWAKKTGRKADDWFDEHFQPGIAGQQPDPMRLLQEGGIDARKISDELWDEFKGERNNPRRGPEGQTIPPFIATRGMMEKLVLHLDEYMRDGIKARYWYKKSGTAILRYFAGDIDTAKRFSALTAILSSQTEVRPNVWNALVMWDAWHNKKPINQDLFRNNGMPTVAPDQLKLDMAIRFMDTGEWKGLVEDPAWWDKQPSGRKTHSFYMNFVKYIDPEYYNRVYPTPDWHHVTIDTWMRRAFNYPLRKNLGEQVHQDQYRFMQEATRKLAREWGVEADDAQAMIWTGIKDLLEQGPRNSNVYPRPLSTNKERTIGLYGVRHFGGRSGRNRGAYNVADVLAEARARDFVVALADPKFDVSDLLYQAGDNYRIAFDGDTARIDPGEYRFYVPYGAHQKVVRAVDLTQDDIDFYGKQHAKIIEADPAHRVSVLTREGALGEETALEVARGFNDETEAILFAREQGQTSIVDVKTGEETATGLSSAQADQVVADLRRDWTFPAPWAELGGADFTIIPHPDGLFRMDKNGNIERVSGNDIGDRDVILDPAIVPDDVLDEISGDPPHPLSDEGEGYALGRYDAEMLDESLAQEYEQSYSTWVGRVAMLGDAIEALKEVPDYGGMFHELWEAHLDMFDALDLIDSMEATTRPPDVVRAEERMLSVLGEIAKDEEPVGILSNYGFDVDGMIWDIVTQKGKLANPFDTSETAKFSLQGLIDFTGLALKDLDFPAARADILAYVLRERANWARELQGEGDVPFRSVNIPWGEVSVSFEELPGMLDDFSKEIALRRALSGGDEGEGYAAARYDADVLADELKSDLEAYDMPPGTGGAVPPAPDVVPPMATRWKITQDIPQDPAMVYVAVRKATADQIMAGRKISMALAQDERFLTFAESVEKAKLRGLNGGLGNEGVILAIPKEVIRPGARIETYGDTVLWVLEKDVLFQAENDYARGWYRPRESSPGQKGQVHIGETANITTFVHEFGHALWDSMTAQEKWSFAKELGIRRGDLDLPISNHRRRMAEEKMARAFEKFIATQRLRRPGQVRQQRALAAAMTNGWQKLGVAPPSVTLTPRAITILQRIFDPWYDVEVPDGSFFVSTMRPSKRGKGNLMGGVGSIQGPRLKLHPSSGFNLMMGTYERADKAVQAAAMRLYRFQVKAELVEQGIIPNARLLKPGEIPAPGEILVTPTNGAAHLRAKINDLRNRQEMLDESAEEARLIEEAFDFDPEDLPDPATAKALEDEEFWGRTFPKPNEPLENWVAPRQARGLDVYAIPAVYEDWFANMIRLVNHDSRMRNVAKFMDLANDVTRMAAVYLRLAYVPVNLSGNTVFMLLQQGPWLPVNAKLAMDLWRGLSKEERLLMDEWVGAGAAASLAELGDWHVKSISKNVAHYQSAAADLIPRRIALIHELRKAGVLPKWGTRISPEQRKAMVSMLQSADKPGTQANEAMSLIARQAENAMVRFRGMNAFERKVMSRVFFLYPWTRGSAIYTMKFPFEHPFLTPLVAQAGQYGWDVAMEKRGMVQSFLQGDFPWMGDKGEVDAVGDLWVKLIGTESVSPFTTSVDVLRMIQNTLEGVEDGERLGEATTLPLNALLGATVGKTYGRPLDEQLTELAGSFAVPGLIEAILKGGRPATRLTGEQSILDVVARFSLGFWPVPRNLTESRKQAIAAGRVQDRIAAKVDQAFQDAKGDEYYFEQATAKIVIDETESAVKRQFGNKVTEKGAVVAGKMTAAAVLQGGAPPSYSEVLGYLGDEFAITEEDYDTVLRLVAGVRNEVQRSMARR